jgi:iron complex outermembrane receptor protein
LTKLDRSVFTWGGTFELSNKQNIRTFLLYGDLRYQTPGGLTPAEFAADPKQARPRVGSTPSSEQANAGVNQKSFITGMSHEFEMSSVFKNNTSLYGAFSQFNNPTVRNYERRLEPHVGGRTVFSYSPSLIKGELKILTGTELQTGWYNIRVYRNRNGVSDSLQTEDEVNTNLWSAFVQTDYKPTDEWMFTFGASINQNKIKITRLNKFPLVSQSRNYDNELAPRFAVLRKINKQVTIYASVAKGFSPPTSAEVLPSTGIISTGLNAEEGWNYELGTRLNLLEGKLFIDVNAFSFQLKNAIVQRRDVNGADFFINAGSTNQKGVELFLNYNIHQQMFVWASYTYNDFRYKDFKQLSSDFSGKQLPGVTKNNIVVGADLKLKNGFYTNFTFNYISPIQLNDANTFSAAEYYLCNIRVGLRRSFASTSLDVFAGADNLFDENYSLGNDINAAANRFFNAAARRNFTAGLSLFFTTRKKS